MAGGSAGSIWASPRENATLTRNDSGTAPTFAAGFSRARETGAASAGYPKGKKRATPGASSSGSRPSRWARTLDAASVTRIAARAAWDLAGVIRVLSDGRRAAFQIVRGADFRFGEPDHLDERPR